MCKELTSEKCDHETSNWMTAGEVLPSEVQAQMGTEFEKK
jgi:hypothetical protein